MAEPFAGLSDGGQESTAMKTDAARAFLGESAAMKIRWHTISRVLLSGFFIIAGLNHFRSPEVYLPMMPPYLPWPEGLNLIAGAAEVAGGIGLLVPAVRRAAAWGLILLLIAVFPANLHVAMNGWPGMGIPQWVLWARLPLQVVLIGWVGKSGRSAE